MNINKIQKAYKIIISTAMECNITPEELFQALKEIGKDTENGNGKEKKLDRCGAPC